MKQGTSTYFCDKDFTPKVIIKDDRPMSYGWDATIVIGPVTIFLKNQLQVFELIQAFNKAYEQYLSVGDPKNV